jgi:hypothetical protein
MYPASMLFYQQSVIWVMLKVNAQCQDINQHINIDSNSLLMIYKKSMFYGRDPIPHFVPF